MDINNKTIDDVVCNLQEQAYKQYGTKIARHQIKFIIKQFLSLVHNEVAAGNKVNIWGHGTYDSYTFTEREGIDPCKQEPYYIPTHQVPTFRSGQKFKDLVKQKSMERANGVDTKSPDILAD